MNLTNAHVADSQPSLAIICMCQVILIASLGHKFLCDSHHQFLHLPRVPQRNISTK